MGFIVIITILYGFYCDYSYFVWVLLLLSVYKHGLKSIFTITNLGFITILISM